MNLANRDDLNPIPVRIIDKIDPHVRIFKADTSHLLMSFVEGVKLICHKGQVEFFIAKIVGPVHISKPGQLQLKAGSPVTKIDDLMSAVGSFLGTDNFKPDRFFIKGDTLFQIQYIKIKMCKFDHMVNPFFIRYSDIGEQHSPGIQVIFFLDHAVIFSCYCIHLLYHNIPP